MRDPLDNGERTRPRLPLWIAVVSVVIAVSSVSVLVLVLYEETKGPAEILREFARRVDRHDCEGSYDLLDESVRADVPEEQWCTEMLGPVDEGLDADFDLESAFLEDDVFEVEISGVDLTTWRLRRFGERSWRVLGPTEGLTHEFTVEGSIGTFTDIENIP